MYKCTLCSDKWVIYTIQFMKLTIFVSNTYILMIFPWTVPVEFKHVKGYRDPWTPDRVTWSVTLYTTLHSSNIILMTWRHALDLGLVLHRVLHTVSAVAQGGALAPWFFFFPLWIFEEKNGGKEKNIQILKKKMWWGDGRKMNRNSKGRGIGPPQNILSPLFPLKKKSVLPPPLSLSDCVGLL